jgi:hypothetical protein
MSLIERIKDTISRKRRWGRLAVRQDAFEDDLIRALDDVRDELRRKRARLQLLRKEQRRERERIELHDEIAALEAIRDTLIDSLDARRNKSQRVNSRLDEARDRLEELRAIRRRRAAANDGPDSGEGPWAGTQSIIELEVLPVFARFGVPVTSLKRAADHPLSISNPSSDHNMANTTAYAADGATYNGEPVARAIATALGISGFSVGNYNGYTIYRAGNAFRVQILWAVSGHYDHVHVGIRRL